MRRDARTIIAALGGRNGMARCPAHRDRDPSLSVRERDGRLLVHCHAGCDQRAVIAALRERGLWPEREPEPRRSPRRRHDAPPAPPPNLTVHWHTRDAPASTQRACAIWRESIPLWDPRALPAMRYLTSRGILWPWPETLAFARLPHPDTGEADVPALIVARHCPVVGMVRGIQRVFLTEDGNKYPAGTTKMSLGRIDGGRAELMPPGEELAIAEGVETALSASRIFGIPAWAMCGSFPGSIALPEIVRSVTLVADHDPHGISEQRARALASCIRQTGRYCRVLMPEDLGADANDVLREAS